MHFAQFNMGVIQRQSVEEVASVFKGESQGEHTHALHALGGTVIRLGNEAFLCLNQQTLKLPQCKGVTWYVTLVTRFPSDLPTCQSTSPFGAVLFLKHKGSACECGVARWI
ncbi:unnamed protein product [Arctogadus glacialis]